MKPLNPRRIPPCRIGRHRSLRRCAMSPSDVLLKLLLIGAGATLLMDLWTLFRRRAFGIPSLDYAAGRPLARPHDARPVPPCVDQHRCPSGRRTRARLDRALRDRHRVRGTARADRRPDVIDAPTPLPALVAGLASVVAPFFVMQPAFGFGIAASRHAATGRRAPAQPRHASVVRGGAGSRGVPARGADPLSCAPAYPQPRLSVSSKPTRSAAGRALRRVLVAIERVEQVARPAHLGP
ncbi:hypothetical protein IST439_06020 [Burkholderia cenocepacia]|nr:hypothetical protein IST439_06020 [Burkholderia cenocepacia]